MEIQFSETAFDDLIRIKKYYNSAGAPEVGEKLVAQIVEGVELLAEFPEMGRVVPEVQSEKFRELLRSNYRVVYFREEKYISIVRVWRSERPMTLA